MNSKGEIVKISAVRFERTLPGPVERVWDFLTRADLLPAWYGNGTIEPRAGGSVMLMDGHIKGIVTQFQPPRLLAYTWNVFYPGEAVSQHSETYLQFELSVRGTDIVLVLTHFPIPPRFEKQTSLGWHTYLDLMDAALRGRPAQERGPVMQANAALYDVDLNNLQR